MKQNEVSLQSKIILPENISVWKFYLAVCCDLQLMSLMSSAAAARTAPCGGICEGPQIP